MKNRRSWLAAALCAASLPSLAFTQKGSKGGIASPVGHEYLCLKAALDVTDGAAKALFADTDQKALAAKYKGQLDALSKNGTLERMGWKMSGVGGTMQSWWYGLGTGSRYEEILKYSMDAGAGMVTNARSLNAFSIAVGQRWVDEMGFATGKAVVGTKKIGGYTIVADCFDAVAQEPEANMADHFMRRGDKDGWNTVAAYGEAISRFKYYFRQAATAPDALIPLRDGSIAGGYKYIVNRPFVYLGRTAHLVQDSFSPEHTIRGVPGKLVVDPPYYTNASTWQDYKQLVEIKDWDCLPGTYQHAHPTGGPGFAPTNDSTGDIIWKGITSRTSWFGAPVTDLKPFARAAYEATKDLYAAFARARRAPNTADAEASAFIKKWLTLSTSIKYDKVPKNGKLHRPACQKDLTVADRKAKDAARLKILAECLKPIGRMSTDARNVDYNKPPFFWRNDNSNDDQAIQAYIQQRGKK